MAQGILILDCGSQFTQLISRRIREIGVYSEVLPWDASFERIKTCAPLAIVLSGGPSSVNDAKAPTLHPEILTLNIPILGICYGMQMLAHVLGGRVEACQRREYGQMAISTQNSPLFKDIPSKDAHIVWMSHGDSVVKLPPNFIEIAHSIDGGIAAIAYPEKNIYGLQFHPEVTHSAHGLTMLKNFVLNIADCAPNWNVKNYADSVIPLIREKVGSDKVLLALSGGVDSSVVAALIHRAIGNQLTCIFVDNGLLRKNEVALVQQAFNQELNIQTIDASDRFLSALAGISDPEQKRKIIGAEFIHVFQEEAQKIKGMDWLAQGTIYPDVIESAGNGSAHTIKSHHNVGGLPDTLKLKLLEPLRDLFKDEVRKLGLYLGLPESLVYRHPFPGPGLAVRILGAIRKEQADLLREADDIFLQELHKLKDDKGISWYNKVSQAFVVFLPVQSVGVMGDGRTYESVVALRAVQTDDFMTANWAPLPFELLNRVSSRIINEVRGINRVVYDISNKPPATIEWE